MEKPDSDKYYQLAVWFLGNPEKLEAFIRRHGNLDDFDNCINKLKPIVEREERRRWLFETASNFLKIIVAVGAASAAAAGMWPLIKGLLGW